MKTLRKMALALVATSLVGFSTIASAGMWCGGGETPYRTYYLDRHCNYYYIDANGDRVMSGRYTSGQFTGLTLKKDCCSKRWFYQDMFGNKMYVSRRCA